MLQVDTVGGGGYTYRAMGLVSECAPVQLFSPQGARLINYEYLGGKEAAAKEAASKEAAAAVSTTVT